jgi:molybdopterin converting factor small subunit
VRQIAQSTNVSFELHTLGWEAFQNLCGVVLREVLGQTVTVFSPTRDAGQDGAFQGKWQRRGKETYTGRFVIQCKFTADRDTSIGLSNLKAELEKARKLAEKGLCETYLLITNAKLSGEADTAIRGAFTAIRGIKFFDAFGREWITQQIRESRRLRAYVPRIYGLGDLSQIIDERVYRQTSEILQNWKDNLAKFVPTNAHHRSVRALLDHSFVLLLGEPMAGKSTIAAALALAAADQWKCVPVFATTPEEVKLHWNPDEPHQFFWVDDVFGQIQFEPALAAGWNRVFPHMLSAIRNGARVLFTSRTYVYRAAAKHLKVSSFPLLGSSQVIIEVEKLLLIEKQRILYNHLRLGEQQREFRRSIKPFLPAVAANEKFFPEIARRLADPLFTEGLRADPESLRHFVEEPKELLGEIITQQSRANFAALAILFMRAGRISIPIGFETNEREAIERLGTTLAETSEALEELNGSLVSQSVDRGERFWIFRHPTIRDAMAAHVVSLPDLVDVYLSGVKPGELLREVVCGDIEYAGAKVHIPPSRFARVIEKLKLLERDSWSDRYTMITFLAYKCSDEFLRQWATQSTAQLETVIADMTVNHPFGSVLARLHDLQALSENTRAAFVDKLADAAADQAETMFLEDDVAGLLTADDREMILNRVKAQLVPYIEWNVEELENNYDDPEYDVDDYFASLRSGYETFSETFQEPEIVDAFQTGLQTIENAIKRIERRNEEREWEKSQNNQDLDDEMRSMAESRSVGPVTPVTSELLQKSIRDATPPRNIFDDVDQ